MDAKTNLLRSIPTRTTAIILAVVPIAGWMPPAFASAMPLSQQSCLTETLYFVGSTKSSGWNWGGLTSNKVAGPFTITYNKTATSTQTFGTNAEYSVSSSVIIAKSEAKFGVNYSYTTSLSGSFSYSSVIPAGKEGLIALLHRQDRITFWKEIVQPNCTTATYPSRYSYVPLASLADADYCWVRDLGPTYSYSSWKPSCVSDQ